MAAADPQSGLLIISPIDHVEQDQESGSSHPSVGSKTYSLEFWLHTSMTFLVGLGCAVLGAASPRVLEMAICRHYFRHHDPSSIPSDGNIPESSCKIKDIQASFTFMMTAVSTCTNLAGSFSPSSLSPCANSHFSPADADTDGLTGRQKEQAFSPRA